MKLKYKTNMEIKKYIAKNIDNDTDIIGYIIELRRYLGNGTYSNEIDYLMCVNEKSMPNSIIRGNFFVKKESIKEFFPCVVCGVNQVKEEYFNSACSDKCYNDL